jgi:kynurenine formamidase
LIATITHQNNTFQVDLSNPIDISLPLSNTEKNPIAWYIEKPQIEPVRFGSWVGSVKGGATTNFNNIFFNPHGHGTHTECLGHITKEFYSINQALKTFFFTAQLISIQPEQQGDDFVITKKQIEKALKSAVQTLLCNVSMDALIIRTLPNLQEKKSKNY